jgi:osmotically-inducible protein OsmY
MSEILLTDDGVTEFAAANIAAANNTARLRKDAAHAPPGLASQARAVLQKSKIYTLRKLQVEQTDGAIILRGRVESFYHKQLAQELIRTAIDGVEVINALQVVYNRERSLTESDYYTP